MEVLEHDVCLSASARGCRIKFGKATALSWPEMNVGVAADEVANDEQGIIRFTKTWIVTERTCWQKMVTEDLVAGRSIPLERHPERVV